MNREGHAAREIGGVVKQVVVRYRVKAEHLAEHEAKLRAVFDALARERPDGLAYAATQLDDATSFVHVATVTTADGSNPLTALPAFRAFVAGIAERCEVPPSTSEGTPFGVFP